MDSHRITNLAMKLGELIHVISKLPLDLYMF